MSFADKFVKTAQRILPSPFTIAVLLTGFTIVLALLFTESKYDHVLIEYKERKKTVSLQKTQKLKYTINDKDSISIKIEAPNIVRLEDAYGVQLAAWKYDKKDKDLPLFNNFNIEPGLFLKTSLAQNPEPYFFQMFGFWEGGFFNFLGFAMQMMLILVLGHVLALTRPANRAIQSLVKHCDTTPKAAFLVTFVSVFVALINWGLALVLGAIFARKVGEYAAKNQISLNYPLIGASGYAGLMVWHGGLSGSAPLKIAEEGHRFADKMGVRYFDETIFSTMNLVCMTLLLILVPLGMYWMGKRSHTNHYELPEYLKQVQDLEQDEDSSQLEGAERLDHNAWLARILGGIMIIVGLYKVWWKPVLSGQGFDWQFRFINPNYIIFMLFGFAILLHGSFSKFNKAVGQGIGGSAGIMIQFPLYAGIMGIMISSGLVNVISDAFVNISNETTFPLFTFFSSGLVNIFVPSGGGQWMVQAPILIEASNALQVPIEKSVMALCYGDQVTNMLQPFWALPLLGITGLKAKEILPYTLFLLLMGIVIFCTILMLF